MIAWIGIKPKANIYDRAGVVVGAKGNSTNLNFDPLAGLCDVYPNLLVGRETHLFIFRMAKVAVVSRAGVFAADPSLNDWSFLGRSEGDSRNPPALLADK
jgi:hypothetical protein